MTKEDIYEELYEILLGELMEDEIDKELMYEVLDHYEGWSVSASVGDVYFYHGFKFIITK